MRNPPQCEAGASSWSYHQWLQLIHSWRRLMWKVYFNCGIRVAAGEAPFFQAVQSPMSWPRIVEWTRSCGINMINIIYICYGCMICVLWLNYVEEIDILWTFVNRFFTTDLSHKTAPTFASQDPSVFAPYLIQQLVMPLRAAPRPEIRHSRWKLCFEMGCSMVQNDNI